MSKEQYQYNLILRERIEAKGVNLSQASIIMGFKRTYLEAALSRPGMSVATLLKIEHYLGVECLNWGYQKVDTKKVLKKPFVSKEKDKR